MSNVSPTASPAAAPPFWITYKWWNTLFVRNAFVQKRSAKNAKRIAQLIGQVWVQLRSIGVK
jgi:hypothetical protein